MIIYTKRRPEVVRDLCIFTRQLYPGFQVHKPSTSSHAIMFGPICRLIDFICNCSPSASMLPLLLFPLRLWYAGSHVIFWYLLISSDIFWYLLISSDICWYLCILYDSSHQDHQDQQLELLELDLWASIGQGLHPAKGPALCSKGSAAGCLATQCCVPWLDIWPMPSQDFHHLSTKNFRSDLLGMIIHSEYLWISYRWIRLRLSLSY